ncbi:MAG TPA: hypothetical protein VGM78_09165 [Ilumatobacteraceae bacterium]
MSQWIIDAIEKGARAAAIRELDLPHVVHVYDTLLGTPTVIGSFPDPITASEFADDYLDAIAANNQDRDTFVVTVIPIENPAEVLLHR